MLKTIETIIGQWITFIKAHEKLLLACIVAFTVFHLGDKAYDAYNNHVKATLSAAVTTDNSKIAQLDAQNAQTQATLTALIASVNQRITNDEAKIAQSKQTTIVKQQQDAALPLPQLSVHWQELLSLPSGSVAPQANGTVAVTTDAAHATVNELEKVQPLTEQLESTQDELKGCNDVKGQQATQILGLQASVAVEKKGREDDAKLAAQNVKDAKKKGFWKGTKVGSALAIVGIIALRVLVK